MVFRSMSSSETTGNSSVAYTQCFTEDIGLQLQLTVSAVIPDIPHTPILVRGLFSRLYYGSLALQPAALLALLFGADQICIWPTRTFTSELPTAWSPLPSPDIATVPTGQLHWRDLHPLDHQLASLH